MKIWFLSWIIPSMSSFVLTSLMLFHLLIFGSIYQHIFPFLFTVTSIGDIIQCVSLLISSCPHRVILFHTGLLIKCLSSLWSLILLAIYLNYHQRYHQRTIRLCNLFWLLLSILNRHFHSLANLGTFLRRYWISRLH
jgi:hypothetical protein